MAIEVIDTREVANRTKKRTVVLNTKKFHAWVHYYVPGQIDEMHCHNEDQTFYIIDGECTMRFPDGGAAVLEPGMMALIHGGDFYQLENASDGPLVMIGNRSGASETTMKIDYVTRKPLSEKGPGMKVVPTP